MADTRFRLEKKFRNAIKEMESKHKTSVIQLDNFQVKNMSNRPRYDPEVSVTMTMADRSMRSTGSIRPVMSAKSGRK